jgi:hypothetical protein
MNIIISALFSLFLLLVSGALMFVHWRGWKALRREQLPEAEGEYRRRQFRRRMSASGTIGVVGIALFLGDTLIPWIDERAVTLTFWLVVILLTIWIALLAFVDIFATKRYIGRISEDQILEQTQLHAELFRLSRERLLKQKTDDEERGN